MIRLFIENREIDLDENVLFAITKQFEELNNPTTIINDWSKTVSIPFTAKNHKTFGHIYNPDKVTVAGSGMGIYFDPLKKLDFRLEWDGAVLMNGYAKMNEIKQNDGKGTYDITLFGQLGKVFQEMQKITFDTTTDEPEYLIDGSEYVAEYIDKTLVNKSWTSSGQEFAQLYPRKLVVPGGGVVDHPAYRVTDIIGFAPNVAFSEGFSYDTFLNSSSSSMLFSEYLDNLTNFRTNTGVTGGTAVGSGLSPRQVGEFRSYNQLPFIYWNKLFQLFQTKAEAITGYAFDLDSSWFSTSNPYWYNLVYMLKPFNTKKGDEMNNYYTGKSDINEFTWSKNTGQIPYSTVQGSGITLQITSESTPRLQDNKLYLETYDKTSISSLNLDFYLTGEMNHDHDILFTTKNMFLLYLNFVGQNGYAVSKAVGVYRGDTSDANVLAAVTSLNTNGDYLYPIAYANRYGTYQSGITSSSQYGWHIQVSGTNLIQLNKRTWGDYVTMTVTAKWLNNLPVFGAAEGSSISEFCWLSNINFSTIADVQQNIFNSGSYFILNDLWNNEYNLFELILNYCKMYRILVYLDEVNKKIVFKQSKNYFANYTIKDWTNKLDKSKDFIIKPITFDNKYVLFNYKDSESIIAQKYKEKYGYNFGEYRLTTDYNFDENSKSLFNNISESIVFTDNVLSQLSLYRTKIIYTFGKEIFINNRNKDGKQIDNFGAFYFHNGLANFDTSGELVAPAISDDSIMQQNNNIYYYTYIQSDRQNVLTYPNLDIVKGNNMCLFNIPKENYTYLNNYSGKATIYGDLWATYLNERYNVQNKKITCYLRLSPIDWQNFDYNHFVKINNQIYMVNKIYDYDITANVPTKVDLITILSIAAYTS